MYVLRFDVFKNKKEYLLKFTGNQLIRNVFYYNTIRVY